jgi:glycosyltransferase involved in cell wall biosynthesis
MRVGVDIRALTAAPYSGIGRQALALCNTLRAREGTELVPFTHAPADHPHRSWACTPAKPVSIGAMHRPLARYRFEHDFLPEAISALAVDVYIATVNMGLPLGLSDVRRRRTRWVLQMHDVFQLTERNRHLTGLQAWVYRQLDRWSIRHATRLADAIWVPSAYTGDAVASLFPDTRSRIRVLPNAVPVEPWQRLSQDVYTPQRYWLLVGTREPRKNIPWFLSAWQQARDNWPELIPPLVVIGHPADVPQVPQHVRFVHGINDAQLGNWYRQAERLWHPAWAEGFGLPVVEATACGTPVATARGSALDEVTPPTSPRFDPHDQVSLVQLMHRLARQGRGEGESPEALQAWAARFDLPAYGVRVDELLKELA